MVDAASEPAQPATQKQPSDAAQERARKKELAKLEGQLEKVEREIATLHEQMAAAATDYERLAALNAELQDAEARRDSIEEAWLEAAQ